MLIPQRFWAGIRDGTVTVAFRRQKRPTVKQGGTLQSPAGLLAIDSLARIEVDDITDRDARAAGYTDRLDAISQLRPEGDLYRIGFHRVGDDPRVDLRREPVDTAVVEQVARLDWGRAILELIADRPGVVSTELAATLGMERLPFKAKVRRLKALGLTESLDTGYRISPRGEAVLARLRTGARTRGDM